MVNEISNLFQTSSQKPYPPEKKSSPKKDNRKKFHRGGFIRWWRNGYYCNHLLSRRQPLPAFRLQFLLQAASYCLLPSPPTVPPPPISIERFFFLLCASSSSCSMVSEKLNSFGLAVFTIWMKANRICLKIGSNLAEWFRKVKRVHI